MANAVLSHAMERLLVGEDIGRAGAREALEEIMSGNADDVQTAGFLVALRSKGETSAELAGLAETIRAHAMRVNVPVEGLVDTCGTGGGRPSFNISTAAAFVAAGAGARVAKHGNRAVTSRSGSADVLEALGARVDLDADAVARCIERSGVGFMFAPSHHPAFRHVVPVRRSLGVRTAFNILGPLSNPAGARRQVIGVFDPASVERVAGALAELGTDHALVVRGRDGLDELSTGAVSDVAEVTAGEVRLDTVDPADFGFPAPTDVDVAGGGPEENAQLIRRIFGGEAGAPRDLVVLNAAAALWVGGMAPSLATALPLAEKSIDEGAARERLEAFVAATLEHDSSRRSWSAPNPILPSACAARRSNRSKPASDRRNAVVRSLRPWSPKASRWWRR
jgi:anthranilate phosphoribosyltransferase